MLDPIGSYIYETADALSVILEMPGVEKDNVEVRVKDDVLSVEGRLDLSKYQGLQPLYTLRLALAGRPVALQGPRTRP